jgi:hypothetical protein
MKIILTETKVMDFKASEPLQNTSLRFKKKLHISTAIKVAFFYEAKV